MRTVLDQVILPDNTTLSASQQMPAVPSRVVGWLSEPVLDFHSNQRIRARVCATIARPVQFLKQNVGCRRWVPISRHDRWFCTHTSSGRSTSTKLMHGRERMNAARDVVRDLMHLAENHLQLASTEHFGSEPPVPAPPERTPARLLTPPEPAGPPPLTRDMPSFFSHLAAEMEQAAHAQTLVKYREEVEKAKRGTPLTQDCAVCMTNKRIPLALTCGHVALCGDCALKLSTDNCPMCREKILDARAYVVPE